jgi:hypothetical protein
MDIKTRIKELEKLVHERQQASDAIVVLGDMPDEEYERRVTEYLENNREPRCFLRIIYAEAKCCQEPSETSDGRSRLSPMDPGNHQALTTERPQKLSNRTKGAKGNFEGSKD